MLLSIALLASASLLCWIFQGRRTRRTSITDESLKQQGLHLWPAIDGWLPGNVDILYKATRNVKEMLPGAAMASLAIRFGNTFTFKILGSKFMYTQDPEVIRHILGQNADCYVKGQFLNDVFNDVLGTGIFNSDGEQWKTHRNIARPFFLRENLEDFSVYAKHTDALVATIRRLASAGSVAPEAKAKAVEFHDLVARFTLDAASEFLFGESVDTLSAASPGQPDPPYLSAFDRIQNRLAARLRVGSFWRLFESKGSMAADMKIVSQLVDKAVSQSAARTKQGITTRDQPTFLDLLDQPKNHMNAEMKHDELLNVMMAARDTTASMIASLFYELSKHSDVQSQLRAEIKARLGDDMRLTFEDVKHLKLLRAVINETLRMYPPISANSRVALRDDKIEFQGEHYLIPAGTFVAWGVLQLQRRQDIWGADANQWRPDRWLDDEASSFKTAAAFQAWGSGPRICIGQELAYLETSYLVCQLLQEFPVISFAPDCQPPQSWIPGKEGLEVMPQVSVVTLTLRGGVWLRFADCESDNIRQT